MAFRMGLLGKKVGMTQTFTSAGVQIPLCAVQTGPCVVLDVLTPERNGYAAIRLGFDEKQERRTTKPELGLFAKARTSPKRFVREIRLAPGEIGSFKVGQTISVGEVFQVGDILDVTGTSKGKGFQGVIKRYHFRGFRATHGTHEYFRHGGSIGCRLTPGRVFKGQRMAGQMGNRRVTVQNVQVVEVLEERNVLLLGGSVPGAPDGYLVLRLAMKRPGRSFEPRAVTVASEPETALEAEVTAPEGSEATEAPQA